MVPTRNEAWELLKEYNKDEYHLRHALAVEGVMRHFAQMEGEDAEKWGVIGLLHDLDFELYPKEHCIKVQEILKEKNFDESYIRAIASHGYGICVDIAPVHIMEKVLFTIDELTGIITATALMRPSKSVNDLELKSVKKKYKTPTFAAGCDRELISRGCDMIGWDLDYVIENTILGMRTVADPIGLGDETEVVG